MSDDFFEKKLDKKRNRLSKIIDVSDEISSGLKDDIKKPHGLDGHKGFKRLKLPVVLERFKTIHGDTYDYSKVKYKNIITPITIICKKHGNFLILPKLHFRKVGCDECKEEKSKEDDIEDWDDFEEVNLSKKRYLSDEGRANLRRPLSFWLKKFKEHYGDRFDYSELDTELDKGIPSDKTITIICKEHGKFKTNLYSHARGRHGCPKCNKHPNRLSTEDWLKRIKKVHGNKYDISKVKNIKTRDDKILIGCSKHGEFSRIVSNFASGSGCSLCLEDAKKSRGYKKPHPSLSQEKVIDRFKKVHGNRYDYSKVNYVNGGTKVIIICKEHGEFKTTPHIHKGGSNCKKCTDSNRRKGYKGSSQ